MESAVSAPAQENFADLFAKPPAPSRILKIIHSWPDNPKSQDDLIARLQQQGFGGVVCNVAFNDYLESDSAWRSFTRAVNEARKAGFALWLYDERGYPSGNAGGLVLRGHPEWEARGLLIADAETGGGEVILEVPPGKLLLSAAFPIRDGRIIPGDKIELVMEITDGKFRWRPPPGRWHAMVITESRLFEGTHAEMNLWAKIPYVNLLMPEPTARFLEVTHDRYVKHLGSELSKSFMATFTDEPSLMSLFLRRMPYRVLPWAPNLPTEFRKRRGYALEPILPALVVDAGSDGQRHRYDYWRTVGELVSENFFGQIQNWCRAHQMLSGGHLLMEEDLTAHVPLYGDFFRCARRLDAPSIDCLTSVPAQVPWFIARLLSSAAELEGKTVVMSETSDHSQRYRPAGDKRPPQTVSEAEIRGTCNRLAVSGVNAITSYYSFADLTDEQLRRLNEWVGRCCTTLTGGHQVTDLTVLYPIESLWPKFEPARHRATESAAATRIEALWRAAAESLFATQRDFTFVDGRALAEAEVKPGALVHGNLRWRVVILPGADTLPLATWEKLASFVESGGIVIALGALPANSEADFPSPRVKALAEAMFGSPPQEPGRDGFHSVPDFSRPAGRDVRDAVERVPTWFMDAKRELGSGNSSSELQRSRWNEAGGAGIFLPSGSEALLSVVLDQILAPDVKVTPPRSPVRTTHRRIRGREVYFAINDANKAWEGEIEFSASGPGEQWDPASGTQTQSRLGNRIRLRMQPSGAMFFRFPAALPPRRHRVAVGALPRIARHVLPETTPLTAKGEFVRAELKRDDEHSTERRPAWKAASVLTKGQVDTFLFVRLPFPQTVDFRQADSLILDTWVSERQKTPNQLLVILHEKDGGDFFAATGRSLGTPGHEQTLIPLARFQLAGWSKDGDGELDLQRVDEVRVGWGGYYGSEGETVDFSLALPEIGSHQ